MKSKNLIIFGVGQIAEVVYMYFTYDSPYQVVAFTADKDYIGDQNEKFGLPIEPFESIENNRSPQENELFVAVSYNGLNQTRANICEKAKEKGFSLASYVNSNVKLWECFKLKENTFIFEDNVIQPFVEIGKNVILWSGNHIGHHSKIGDNVFIASHVVVSGSVNIGDNTFIGVNATIRDNVNVGEDCIIGAGSLVLKNIRDKAVLSEKTTKRLPLDSSKFNEL